jgi:hypothetical protein
MRKSNKGSPQRRMKQRNLHMHKLSTPAHPFQFNIQPWFSLTVRLTSLTTSLSIQGLRLAMISQLGLNFTGASDSTFDVRLQRAYFWGGLLPMNSASVLQPLTVTVRDLFITIGNDSGFPDLNSLNVLEQYADYPNQVSRAKLGFEYSDAHKQAVIPADIANTSTIFNFSGMGSNSVMYLQLLWRPAATATANIFPAPGMAPSAAPPDYDSESESIGVDDDFIRVKPRRAASTKNGGRRVAS